MQLTEIQKCPNLDSYAGLRAEMDSGNLVIFLGAGVSRLVDCKSWDELADNLITKCYDLKYITFHEAEALKSYPSQKKKISIAYGILKKKDEEAFYEVFDKSLEWKTEHGKKNIYDYLALLSDTFVTTNADTCIDSHFIPNDVVYDFSHTKSVSRHKVFHIHGCQKHRESLVFTVEQYLDRYQNTPNNNYLHFLDDLFSHYTVLFIGYGLEEFELLDYLTLKAKVNKSTKRHYALLPYFSFEKKMAEYDQIYYNSLNIQIIPYAKDDKGYNQLIDIIDDWGNKTSFIKQIDTELTELFSKDTFSRDDIIRITEIIAGGDSFLACFLRLCEKKPSMTVYLIKPLYDNGYFNPDNNTEYWPILSFLYSYVRCYKGNSTSESVKYFIKILDENTQITSDRKRNWRTDNSLLELIFSLAEENISENHLLFLEYLFEGRKDTFEISHTLSHIIVPYALTFSNKDKIRRIIKVAFSYVDDGNGFSVSSVVNTSFLRTLVKDNIEKIFIVLGKDFFDVILEIISSMTARQLQFIVPKNYKSVVPVIDDGFYNGSLFNILLWLLKKQDNVSDILTALLVDENPMLRECGKKLQKTIEENEDVYDESYDDGSDVYIIEDETDSLDIQSLSIDEILVKISEHKNSRNLAHKIELWVLAHLEKGVLDKFISADLVYLDSITAGIDSLVRSEKEGDNLLKKVPFILDFFKNILSSIRSSTEDDAEREICWIHKNICNFISDYIEKYVYVLQEEQYDTLKSIILMIYKNLNSFSFEDTSAFGYASNLLNSEAGVCFRAMFFLQAYCFTRKKKADMQIENLFEKEILEQQSSDIFTLIGKNFHYLFAYDKNWLKKQYTMLTNPKNALFFKAFCSGYFYTPYQISNDCYSFLKEKGFYDELLHSGFDDSEYFRRLSNIAYIVFMRNFEEINDSNSLLNKIIKTGNVQFLNPVIDYFSAQYNKKNLIKLFLYGINVFLFWHSIKMITTIMK